MVSFSRWILVGLVAAITSGCVLDHIDRLERQRSDWAAAGIEDYSFILDSGNICGPIEFEVYGGAVVDREALDPFGRVEELGSLCDVPPEQHRTIDHLFDQVRDLFEEADDVEVTYDDDYGYPAAVNVDPSFDWIDDEWGFRVKNFRVNE